MLIYITLASLRSTLFFTSRPTLRFTFPSRFSVSPLSGNNENKEFHSYNHFFVHTKNHYEICNMFIYRIEGRAFKSLTRAMTSPSITCFYFLNKKGLKRGKTWFFNICYCNTGCNGNNGNGRLQWFLVKPRSRMCNLWRGTYFKPRSRIVQQAVYRKLHFQIQVMISSSYHISYFCSNE